MNKSPQCDLCGDYAPYGDERNMWIGYHLSWYHKLYYKIKNYLTNYLETQDE